MHVREPECVSDFRLGEGPAEGGAIRHVDRHEADEQLAEQMRDPAMTLRCRIWRSGKSPGIWKAKICRLPSPVTAYQQTKPSRMRQLRDGRSPRLTRTCPVLILLTPAGNARAASFSASERSKMLAILRTKGGQGTLARTGVHAKSSRMRRKRTDRSDTGACVHR
jgi:hypothetical protein